MFLWSTTRSGITFYDRQRKSDTDHSNLSSHLYLISHLRLLDLSRSSISVPSAKKSKCDDWQCLSRIGTDCSEDIWRGNQTSQTLPSRTSRLTNRSRTWKQQRERVPGNDKMTSCRTISFKISLSVRLWQRLTRSLTKTWIESKPSIYQLQANGTNHSQPHLLSGIN